MPGANQTNIEVCMGLLCSSEESLESEESSGSEVEIYARLWNAVNNSLKQQGEKRLTRSSTVKNGALSNKQNGKKRGGWGVKNLDPSFRDEWFKHC